MAEPVEDSVDEISSEGDSDVEESKGPEGSAPKNRQDKNERKSRKLLGKLGMKPVDGVTKVCIKKSKQIYFVVNKPDVYKLPNSDTYVIFGEAKVEDMSQNSALEAAQRLSQLSSALQAVGADRGTDSSAAAHASGHDHAHDHDHSHGDCASKADESSVNQSDIDLVVSQVGCTREQAVEALIKNKGDIVETIMQLST
uniref:Nascent polypeptide-associated complex subunit alpha n=2 Tax=Babesia divergens TaxID=32595 RepID=NACA_BABDI|nr:RecName: Full=Nascent polypeptide-associated complex subunit alpha; Short=NAC-alpha; AltName: Full=Alpha-NAC [Babesia divergens]AAZ66308.1 putative nascent polypeptide-associated complex alpha chain [Babesia divergens]